MPPWSRCSTPRVQGEKLGPTHQQKCGRWALATCRQAGFEPDVRFTSTDLQIQLHLVQQQLAVALLPRLAGAELRPGVRTHPITHRPERTVFTSTRSGAADHPTISALGQALASTGRA